MVPNPLRYRNEYRIIGNFWSTSTKQNSMCLVSTPEHFLVVKEKQVEQNRQLIHYFINLFWGRLRNSR